MSEEDVEEVWEITLKGRIAEQVLDILNKRWSNLGFTQKQKFAALTRIVEAGCSTIVNYLVPQIMNHAEDDVLFSVLVETLSAEIVPDGPIGDEVFGEICVAIMRAIYEYSEMEVPHLSLTMMTQSGVMDIELGPEEEE